MASAASDVFISYKAEDRKRLIPLVEALEAEGFSVWWDQHIGGGTNWREEIETHLDAAKVVLVVWSKRTIGPEGRFVRDEAGAAQEAGHYLPVTVDNVRPPLGFREVQAIDLSSWKGNRADRRFETLADTIRNRLEGKEIRRHPVGARVPVVSRRSAIASGAGVVALAAVGGFFLLKPGAANATRIAVLPFKNMSGESEAYFADGLAEELRGALSRAGLQVIGRNSSEAVATEDSATIVDKLGVSHILTGSVRRSSETLRISAQLVEGRDGVESWGQNYDRAPGDAIKIQSDIAEQVATSLSVALGVIKQAVEAGGTNDPVVQALMQQAREIVRQQGTGPDAIEASRKLFEQAVARDPNFARAWIYLGTVKSIAAGMASSPEEAARLTADAERDIRHGIEIAPGIAPGHSGLASIAQNRLQLSEALSETRKALEAEPNSPPALTAAMNILPWIGQRSEAAEAAARLRSLEPLNPTAFDVSALAAAAEGRANQAIAYAQRAVELAPQNQSVIAGLANRLLEADRDEQARSVAEKLSDEDFNKLVVRAILASRQNRRAAMDDQVAALRRMFGDFASYQYAQIFAQAGEPDRAFAALETGITVKDPGLASMMRDPLLEPLRGDARFPEMIRRLEFPIIDPQVSRA